MIEITPKPDEEKVDAEDAVEQPTPGFEEPPLSTAEMSITTPGGGDEVEETKGN